MVAHNKSIPSIIILLFNAQTVRVKLYIKFVRISGIKYLFVENALYTKRFNYVTYDYFDYIFIYPTHVQLFYNLGNRIPIMTGDADDKTKQQFKQQAMCEDQTHYALKEMDITPEGTEIQNHIFSSDFKANNAYKPQYTGSVLDLVKPSITRRSDLEMKSEKKLEFLEHQTRPMPMQSKLAGSVSQNNVIEMGEMNRLSNSEFVYTLQCYKLRQIIDYVS